MCTFYPEQAVNHVKYKSVHAECFFEHYTGLPMIQVCMPYMDYYYYQIFSNIVRNND